MKSAESVGLTKTYYDLTFQVTSENPQLAAQTLPTRPTSSCMLLKGQRQLLEDSTKQAKLWWHNCQKLK